MQQTFSYTSVVIWILMPWSNKNIINQIHFNWHKTLYLKLMMQQIIPKHAFQQHNIRLLSGVFKIIQSFHYWNWTHSHYVHSGIRMIMYSLMPSHTAIQNDVNWKPPLKYFFRDQFLNTIHFKQITQIIVNRKHDL